MLSFTRLSSAINRSELVSEYRRIMPESSQAGIRDVDHPELKPTQCWSLLECDVVRFEARPLANSDLVCSARGWNEAVRDCNGWSRI
jgi:hypothetical protein